VKEVEREIIEVFKESFENVLNEVADIGIKKIEVSSIKPDKLIKTGFIIVISIIGDKSGEVLFEINNETAMNLIQKMSTNKNINNILKEEDNYSLILEFLNILLGRVITNLLENYGVELNISNPILIISNSMEIRTFRKESLYLIFETTIGQIGILISLVDINTQIKTNEKFLNDDFLNF